MILFSAFDASRCRRQTMMTGSSSIPRRITKQVGSASVSQICFARSYRDQNSGSAIHPARSGRGWTQDRHRRRRACHGCPAQDAVGMPTLIRARNRSTPSRNHRSHHGRKLEAFVMTKDITALRLRMRANGFSPLPCMGKVPAMEKWTEKLDCTEAEIRLWPKLWLFAENTGVLAKFTPGLDIDIKIEDAAKAVEDLAREFFEERGDIHVRFGLPPKRLIPLRTDVPFAKLRREFIPPNGLPPGEKPPAIEVLGDGQQYIVAGIHPDTHKPYGWFGGEITTIKREDLPYVRREDMVRFLDAATKLLVEDFGFVLQSTTQATNGGDPHETG